MGKESKNYDEFIRALVPIGGLAPKYQKEIIKQSRIIDYRKGKYVFREGDKDNFNYYVLEGELEMTSNGRFMNRFIGGAEASRYALAQLRPRKLSAKAKTPVTMLRIDKNLLDKFLTLEEREAEAGGAMEVSEIEEGESGDWMTRMLQSELFARIPAVNIQRIFTLMEAVDIGAGDVAIRQGDPGDYYYIIEKGRCNVSVRPASGTQDIKVAELREGDSFGEEALVSDAKRNASVTMATDGRLMRLTKGDFIDLIKKPALQSVTYEQGRKMVDTGSIWLDVRFPEECQESGIEGSINVPLNILRIKIDTLDADNSYVVCCDSGLRSSVAAFLLLERGFKASFLAGGLLQSPVADRVKAEQPPAGKGAAAAGKQKAVARPVKEKKAPKPKAPAEKIPLEAAGKAGAGKEKAERGGDALEAHIRVSALKAELAKANMQVEEAIHLKTAAEAAKQAAEKAALVKLEAEREKLKAKAARDIEVLKEEVEKERQMAVNKAQRKQKEDTGKYLKLRGQVEQRLREEREQKEASHMRDVAEIARVQQQKEEMEKQMLEERKRLEAETVKMKQRLEEALALKNAAEQERLEAEKTVKKRLAEEHAKIEEEANRASEALMGTERFRLEIEEAKRAAEEEAARRRKEEEEELKKLEEETERRLREEEAKLKAEYARNAKELEKIHRMKEETEIELQAEREKLEAEFAEAMNKREEAQRIQDEVENARQLVEKDAGRRKRELEEMEQKLRNEVEVKIREERRKLEAEFANNAAEMEATLVEMDAAKAARRAAEEEAEKIISEYKAEYEKRQEENEERLRVQRSELEAEPRRLREALEEAQRAKDEAEAARVVAEERVARLHRDQERPGRGKMIPTEEQLRAEIAVMEAEVNQANVEKEEAQRARELAQRENDISLEIDVKGDAAAKENQPEDAFARVINQEKIKAIMAQKKRIEQKARAAREAVKNSTQ